MPGEPVLRSVEPIASVSRFENGLNLNVSWNCIEIAQFNANSLLGYINLTRAHLDSHFHHIISISETWLHSGISDDMVRLGDFILIRNDREGRRSGGVACYVDRSFRVKLLALSPSVFSNSPEFLILELSCPEAQSLLFISMYRRPKAILFNDFYFRAILLPIRTLSSVGNLIVICQALASRLPLSVYRSPPSPLTSLSLIQRTTRLQLTRG